MPIQAPVPVTATVLRTEELVCDSLWIMQMGINGRSLNPDDVSASMILLPFANQPTGPVFADPNTNQNHWSTANLNAAAANLASVGLPRMALAIQSVYDATPDLLIYRQARLADVEVAQAAIAPVQADLGNKQITLAAAQNAGVQAQIAFANAVDKEAAQRDLDAANTAIVVAQEAVAAAESALAQAKDKVTRAIAAWRDPANPRV